jgi:hypothetical protein
MGCPLQTSIEHTNRTLVFYGSNKPSSWSPIGNWLTPTALLVGSGEKLSTDPRVGQRCAVDCVGSPFSQEQWDPSKSVGISRKVALCGPREIHMVLDHT